MNNTNHLRYPIGRFEAASNYAPQLIFDLLNSFAELPGHIAGTALRLEAAGRLNETYRPGGWTALQLIHHLADSHLNAYQRFKLTLTEDNPTLRPYDENAWAKLPDNRHGYFVSQNMLSAIHRRLTLTLSALSLETWKRPCHHPSNEQVVNLASLLGQYEWHGRHHLGHLQIILNK
ncbi:metal-dependent hydrolase [Lewinellaceae bacterium SD302]|nr:metal-dependent hydrolase [Lewinellaceae bacterium SD302]